ncbi:MULTISPECIES: hypothetical protein [unclassified Micromonospora]|uniref:hypothetical protein n=1 Tax=unclassified Micromonospora TaxID=2617518 RepID=UPI001C23AC38|nr:MULTISPECIES: hypothetical protein [unclassified Micromonospora]MBU8861519.1 hypothetical protein [Micromonospora sp. WMMB482]MDM4781086.1 hypothetical protein [Micromonospora sp. b486]
MSRPPRLRRSRWLVPAARVAGMFYDLIFVFAFLNVTGLVARELAGAAVFAASYLIVRATAPDAPPSSPPC